MINPKLSFTILTILLAFNLKANKEPTETEKLALTCKVWGFLKYYHPQVAKGNYNWDFALINIIPEVAKTKSFEDLNQLALKSILSLSGVKKCETCSEIEWFGFNKNFDLDWTNDSTVFSSEMISNLNYIEANRNQDSNVYVKSGNVDQGDFSGEKTYENQIFPDKNYRLLDLFRYWNIIEYYFPYKYQIDQNWDSVLYEMIPKFLAVNDTNSYNMALLEMVTKVDDSHASFASRYTLDFLGDKFVSAAIKVIDSTVVISHLYNDSLSKIDDLRIGDVITHLNDTPVFKIIADRWRYLPASNIAVKNRGLENTLLQGSQTLLKLTYIRDGLTKNKVIHRYHNSIYLSLYDTTRVEKKEKWKIFSDNIGYVDMGILQLGDVDTMMLGLQKCKGIIFDIRNYPNGTMYEIAKRLHGKRIPFVKFTAPDFTYPGRFIWKPDYECGTAALIDSSKLYRGEIVLLINEQTQSHAEFTVMSLDPYPRCTIIGSQTAGADGNVTLIKFISGEEVYMTGIGIFYPDGRETQRIGIVPDIVVKPTVKGIQEGRDEVLEEAIRVIND